MITNLLKQVFIFSLLLTILSCTSTSGIKLSQNEIQNLFFEANKLYQNGEYEKASEIYEKIIASNFINGYIFFNLGNSYFRMGKIGKAILNYRKAELFIPNNADLQANLKYAQEQTKDAIKKKEASSILKILFFWYYLFSFKGLIYVLIVINFIFWGIATAKIFWNSEILSWSFYIFLTLLLIFAGSVGVKLYSINQYKGGVIISEKAEIRSGNGINNTLLFELHEGAEFDIVDSKDNWYKIELGDGKKGWVDGNYIGIVR